MRNPFGTLCAALLLCACGTASLSAQEKQLNENKMMEEKLNLAQEWDKVFPQSDKVNHSKVVFHNRYGITLAADLYVPKNAEGKLAAIAVCGPFGAVKEQASGLYAQELAERGFLTIAFDPSFTGESGGQPVMWLRPTSTRKISVRRSIISLPVRMWMPDVSAYSASADGEAWRSMLPASTHASRLRWLLRCMI